MAEAYDVPGSWSLLLVLAAGFVLALVLRALRLLRSEAAQMGFITWGSGLLAAVVALASGPSSSPGLVIEILGRVAIFFLVWIAAGIVFAVGVAAAVEKTVDRREP